LEGKVPRGRGVIEPLSFSINLFYGSDPLARRIPSDGIAGTRL